LKAVILAGGRGSRLRPITDYLPKPLIPIRNIPILEWQIGYLSRFDIREIILCVGYKTDTIRNWLEDKEYGADITLSTEESPLGTGGAIKNASDSLDVEDSFVVLNGDVITNIDVRRLINTRNSIASIPLRTDFGILETSTDGIITEFREKGSIPEMWMNAGIYHLGRETLDDLPTRGNIETTLFPVYAGKGRLKIVRFEKDLIWQSVDSFKDVERCSALLAGSTAM